MTSQGERGGCFEDAVCRAEGTLNVVLTLGAAKVGPSAKSLVL